jgi:serine/threonine protein phosphatase 1
MTLTYAIGDIHGALHKLEALIARCEQHAAGRPMRFVFIGDYVDRGPDSAGVVRRLLALQTKMPNDVVTLMGNHEATLLGVIDGTAAAASWLMQGGAATLRSYGVNVPGDLPRQHLEWMRALPLTHDDGLRFFVHAGIDPELPLDAQDDYDLLWIREPFLSDRRNYGRLIVHGHTPLVADTPDLRSNRLNLDTGAVFGGPLTAAVFSDTAMPPIALLRAE